MISCTSPSTPVSPPIGTWPHPAVIARNNFVYKSLSNWAFNTKWDGYLTNAEMNKAWNGNIPQVAGANGYFFMPWQ